MQLLCETDTICLHPILQAGRLRLRKNDLLRVSQRSRDKAGCSHVKVKSLSHVRLFVTPWTIAYQAPPSVQFSRQEYWSGLPFPSPGSLPDPRIKPRSPTLQADALTSEPPGKLKSTGVGCYFLLQGIFLTQGSNPGLPHCRQMLYRLSHQGSLTLPNHTQLANFPLMSRCCLKCNPVFLSDIVIFTG